MDSVAPGCHDDCDEALGSCAPSLTMAFPTPEVFEGTRIMPTTYLGEGSILRSIYVENWPLVNSYGMRTPALVLNNATATPKN